MLACPAACVLQLLLFACCAGYAHSRPLYPPNPTPRRAARQLNTYLPLLVPLSSPHAFPHKHACMYTRFPGALRAARQLNTNLPLLVDEWASSLFRELDYRR